MIDEIKNRIKIKHLVSELGIEIYKNNFIYSIYKTERTPSLKIYPETNSFYCFATGKGGDVINFYADYKRIELKEAVKELGGGYNFNIKESNRILNGDKIGMNEKQIKKVEPIQKEIYTELKSFCGIMQDKVMDYLKGNKRGLTDETIQKFGLFYISDIDKAVKHLREKFDLKDLNLSGLFNLQNKFVFAKHRLIIPYFENGEINYLRGRYFENGESENDKYSKYISLANNTGNLGVKRFYNVDVLNEVGGGADILVCEGEFDTMIVNQEAGNAIGIAGVSAIPENTKEMLNDYEVYVAFHSDLPGETAAQKFTNMLGKKVKYIHLKNYKDITELYNANA